MKPSKARRIILEGGRSVRFIDALRVKPCQVRQLAACVERFSLGMEE